MVDGRFYRLRALLKGQDRGIVRGGFQTLAASVRWKWVRELAKWMRVPGSKNGEELPDWEMLSLGGHEWGVQGSLRDEL